jgi:MFS family permease
MVGFIRPPCDAGVIRGTPAFPAALSQKRKRLTLAATILGSSMAFIDGSVVNIALPAIQQALHADAASTQWIVNAYLLLLGALVLVGGSAADLYGRRRIFLVGIAVFAHFLDCVRTLAHHRAYSGRAIQVLAQHFDAGQSRHAGGDLLTRTSAAGDRDMGSAGADTAAGPVPSRLVDRCRGAPPLNMPLAVAAAGLAMFFAGESRDDNARRLDWIAAITVTVGLATVTWSLSAIPSSGFRDQSVLAALGVGAAFLVAFIAIEARSREAAMMPLRCTARGILRQPTR